METITITFYDQTTYQLTAERYHCDTTFLWVHIANKHHKKTVALALRLIASMMIVTKSEDTP